MQLAEKSRGAQNPFSPKTLSPAGARLADDNEYAQYLAATIRALDPRVKGRDLSEYLERLRIEQMTGLLWNVPVVPISEPRLETVRRVFAGKVVPFEEFRLTGTERAWGRGRPPPGTLPQGEAPAPETNRQKMIRLIEGVRRYQLLTNAYRQGLLAGKPERAASNRLKDWEAILPGKSEGQLKSFLPAFLITLFDSPTFRQILSLTLLEGRNTMRGLDMTDNGVLQARPSAGRFIETFQIRTNTEALEYIPGPTAADDVLYMRINGGNYFIGIDGIPFRVQRVEPLPGGRQRWHGVVFGGGNQTRAIEVTDFALSGARMAANKQVRHQAPDPEAQRLLDSLLPLSDKELEGYVPKPEDIPLIRQLAAGANLFTTRTSRRDGVEIDEPTVPEIVKAYRPVKRRPLRKTSRTELAKKAPASGLAGQNWSVAPSTGLEPMMDEIGQSQEVSKRIAGELYRYADYLDGVVEALASITSAAQVVLDLKEDDRVSAALKRTLGEGYPVGPFDVKNAEFAIKLSIKTPRARVAINELRTIADHLMEYAQLTAVKAAERFFVFTREGESREFILLSSNRLAMRKRMIDSGQRSEGDVDSVLDAITAALALRTRQGARLGAADGGIVKFLNEKWPSMDVTVEDFRELAIPDRRVVIQALISRLLDRPDELFPIALQDKAVLLRIRGGEIALLDRGKKVLKAFTPTPEEVAEVKGEVSIALEIQPIVSALPGFSDSRSVSDLKMEQDEPVNKTYEIAKRYFTGKRLSLKVDLDQMPEDPAEFETYLKNYLVSARAVSLMGDALTGVTLRFVSSDPSRVDRALEHPYVVEHLQGHIIQELEPGIREVDVVTAAAIEPGKPYLPVAKLQAGQLANFRLQILLAVFEGNVDPNDPEAVSRFRAAYQTAFKGEVGPDFGAAILGFLKGQTDPGFLKYALTPLRAVEWTQVLQFFRNMERMVAQAA